MTHKTSEFCQSALFERQTASENIMAKVKEYHLGGNVYLVAKDIKALEWFIFVRTR